MANRRYADVAAARHMREKPPEPDKGAGPEKKAGRGKRAGTSPRPPKAARRPGQKDKGYRRKRLVALLLTTLVALAVPTLITLLVLFG